MALRIVFMGTPEFAAPALERLIQSRHEVAAVVTQPDKPAGRSGKPQMPPVKHLALEHNLPVLQPEKIRRNNFGEALRPYAPDIIVVVAYGKIVPPEVLALPRFGCVNIHASLLPKYRGAAPIQWAIVRGELKTGVTIMQLDEGMDTGNIIASEELDILEDDDTLSVSNALSLMGAELLLKTLDQIEEHGRVISAPQNHAEATMAPILKKSDGLIDWSLSNEEIIFRIKGLQPWPAAFSFLHGRIWRFLRAEPFEDPDHLFFPLPTGREAKHQRDPDPGTVTAVVRKRGFTVRTGDGHLLVTLVQPSGKRPMSGSDAINGQIVKTGDLFVSDPAFLEGAPEHE